MKHTIISNSIEETIKIGEILGSQLNSKILIGLDGDIGCGKTHLAKGIALGLNITDTVKSPTFNLISEYTEGRLPLYHFDVYRLESIDELYLIGFDDYLKTFGVVIIEWTSLIKEILPENTNYITILKDPTNTNKRIIEFNFAEDYENILKETIDIINKEINHDSFNP